MPYMLTGSYVSSMQGYPRSTHDIDIVVMIDASKIPTLKDAFAGPGFYLDEQSMIAAIQEGGSEKQIQDALGVYELQFGRLDREYLQRWAVIQSVERDLRSLEENAHPVEWAKRHIHDPGRPASL